MEDLPTCCTARLSRAVLPTGQTIGVATRVTTAPNLTVHDAFPKLRSGIELP
jgi:hypothetical protein